MRTALKFSTLFIVVILSCSTFIVTAQESPIPYPDTPPLMGPMTSIEFEETTFDFGEIEAGIKVSHTFTFTNTGDEPLVLSNAKGSCGCTIPQWPRHPIASGETASITVVFNSKNKKGKRNQKVTITANTNPPQTFIYMTGTVSPTDGSTFDPSTISITPEKEEEINPDCVFIFPNPTAEVLKLKMEKSNLGESATISIHSKTGQLMAKRDVQSIDGIIEFSVSHYPPGTYIANIQIADRKPQAHCFVVVD